MKFIKHIQLPRADAKKTDQTFADSRLFKDRDPDLDSWLESAQRAVTQSRGSVFKSEKPINVFEAALCENSCDAAAGVSRSLVQREQTISVNVIEELVILQERGILADLEINGSDNHFWVETARGDNHGVALLILRRDSDGLWIPSFSTCGLTSPKLRKGLFFFTSLFSDPL